MKNGIGLKKWAKNYPLTLYALTYDSSSTYSSVLSTNSIHNSLVFLKSTLKINSNSNK